MDKQPDRRQRKTKAAIQSAFFRLMRTRDIAAVTVKDLADAADINRSTFYLHYADVYAVLEDIERETVNAVFSLAEELDFRRLAYDPLPLLTTVSRELDKIPEFGSFLAESPAASRFLSKIKEQFKDRVVDALRERVRPERAQYLSYCVTFLTSGTVDAYGAWLRDGRPVPLETLCRVIGEQIAHGVQGVSRF